jgi:hypothetical protein
MEYIKVKFYYVILMLLAPVTIYSQSCLCNQISYKTDSIATFDHQLAADISIQFFLSDTNQYKIIKRGNMFCQGAQKYRDSITIQVNDITSSVAWYDTVNYMRHVKKKVDTNVVDGNKVMLSLKSHDSLFVRNTLAINYTVNTFQDGELFQSYIESSKMYLQLRTFGLKWELFYQETPPHVKSSKVNELEVYFSIFRDKLIVKRVNMVQESQVVNLGVKKIIWNTNNGIEMYNVRGKEEQIDTVPLLPFDNGETQN